MSGQRTLPPSLFQSMYARSPVSIWIEDLTRLFRRLETLRSDGVDDLRAWLGSRPDELTALAGLITVLDVNDATVALYRAPGKEDLLGSLDKVISTMQHSTFLDCLCSLYAGEESFTAATVHRRFDGTHVDVVISLPLPRAADSDFVVPVTIVDVSRTGRGRRPAPAGSYARPEESPRDNRNELEMVTICASCKKFQDGQRNWEEVEVLLREHCGRRVSHGICTDCMQHLYPELRRRD